VSAAAPARHADRSFLGLEMGDGASRGRVVVAERLLTPGDRFYGGAGIAIAGAAMEAATGRRLRWVTTQFVSSTGPGSEIEVSAEVGASGRTSAQVLVTGRVEGRTLFNAVGSTDDEPGGVPDGVFATMPEVPDPDACPPLRLPFKRGATEGHLATTELRDAATAESPAMRAWIRVQDHDAGRPCMLGYIADYVPLSIMRGLGVRGAGTSLDNTIRVGAPPAQASPWILVDLLPQVSAGGFGHGSAMLWTQHGEALGIASQTARLFTF